MYRLVCCLTQQWAYFIKVSSLIFLSVYKQGVPLISCIVTFDQNYFWMKFLDVYCFIDYRYLY